MSRRVDRELAARAGCSVQVASYLAQLEGMRRANIAGDRERWRYLNARRKRAWHFLPFIERRQAEQMIVAMAAQRVAEEADQAVGRLFLGPPQ